MTIQDWAFIAAGIIGASVAVLHGILMQRLMINPILEEGVSRQVTRRLLPLLMHFSTFCWFFGGLALIAAPFYLDAQSKATIAVVVAIFYAFGSIGNFWGTRSAHPGWILLALATALILFGVLT